jgi:hypothetical protein
MEKVITSAQYLDDNGTHIALIAFIDGVETGVPLDPANSDYAEILRQVEAGELTIQEATN